MLKQVLIIITNIILAGIKCQLMVTQKYSANYDFMLVNLQFNDPDIILSFPINTENKYSWLDSNSYNFNKKNIIKNETIIADDKPCTALLYKENVKIGSVNISSYHIYLAYIKRYLISSSGYTFGYKIIEENFSLTHLLYKQGKINKRNFNFQPIIEHSQGFINFGGIPEIIYNNRTIRRGKCKVIKDNPFWGCIINQVEFNGKIFKAERYGYINCPKIRIIIDEDSANEFYFPFFNDLVMTKKCKIKEINENLETVICDADIIDKFPEIKFYFDSFYIHFPLGKLFDCTYDINHCHSTISVERGHKEKHFWKFGYQFIKQFILIDFDYDQNELTFYSDLYVSTVENKITINLMIITIILLFCNIIFLCLQKK